jgi:hypothetical protein
VGAKYNGTMASSRAEASQINLPDEIDILARILS